MKVLITGIYGQDGHLLSKIYKLKGNQVYGIVKDKKFKKILYFKDLANKIYENNLINIVKLVVNLIKIRPDVIIHFAAYNTGAGKNNNFFKYYLFNMICFINIFFSFILCCRKSKFLFAGSAMMYSKKKFNIVDEKSNFSPVNAYGKYKYHSHNLMMFFKKIFKLNCTTLILFNHDSKFRNESFLFPRIVRSILTKNYSFLKKIIKSNLFLDISHAEDLCNLIYKISVSKKNHDKLILSSGKLSSVNKVIKKIFNNKKFFNKTPKANFGLVWNNMTIKKEFNYKPKKNISVALKEIFISAKFDNKF